MVVRIKVIICKPNKVSVIIVTCALFRIQNDRLFLFARVNIEIGRYNVNTGYTKTVFTTNAQI